MKLTLPLLMLLLCGCRTLDKKIIERSAAPVSPLASFSNSSEAVITPPQAVLTPDANDPSYIAVSNAPDPEQFQVRIEVSPDLKRWFYFYQLDNSPTIEIPKFVPNMYVRLVGVPWPAQ